MHGILKWICWQVLIKKKLAPLFTVSFNILSIFRLSNKDITFIFSVMLNLLNSFQNFQF